MLPPKIRSISFDLDGSTAASIERVADKVFTSSPFEAE
jgi:hypothetical protein